eukprot:COSAG05_NODE_1015_length_6188_cov_162.395139_7_plen_240_part_00
MDYMPQSAFEAYPLVLESAEGLNYWDITGKRFFDGIGGIFTVSLGHGHPAVVEAAKKQLDKMTFAPPMHGIADVTFDFIEKLSNVCPPGMDYVKTYSGASEAMESAIKFSRQYWKQSGEPGKYKFISRYQSYHGATMGAMSASGTGMRKTPFEPQMPGFLKLWPPTFMQQRLPAGTSWEEVNRICAHMFEVRRVQPSVRGAAVRATPLCGWFSLPSCRCSAAARRASHMLCSLGLHARM